MKVKKLHSTCFLMFLLLSSSLVVVVPAWSNGGFSQDPSNPDYGTHDWIAEHAFFSPFTSASHSQNLPVHFEISALVEDLQNLNQSLLRANLTIFVGNKTEIDLSFESLYLNVEHYLLEAKKFEEALLKQLELQAPHSREADELKILILSQKNVSISLAFSLASIVYFNETGSFQNLQRAIKSFEGSASFFKTALVRLRNGLPIIEMPIPTFTYKDAVELAKLLVGNAAREIKNVAHNVSKIDADVAKEITFDLLSYLDNWLGITQKVVRFIQGITNKYLRKAFEILYNVMEFLIKWGLPKIYENVFNTLIDKLYDIQALITGMNRSMQRFIDEFGKVNVTEKVANRIERIFNSATYYIADLSTRFGKKAFLIAGIIDVTFWLTPIIEKVVAGLPPPFSYVAVVIVRVLRYLIPVACATYITLDGYDNIDDGVDRRWFFWNRIVGMAEKVIDSFKEATDWLKIISLEISRTFFVVGEEATITLNYSRPFWILPGGRLELPLYYLVNLSISKVQPEDISVVGYWEWHDYWNISFPQTVTWVPSEPGNYTLRAQLWENGVEKIAERSTPITVLPADAKIVNAEWRVNAGNYTIGGNLTIYNLPDIIKYAEKYRVFSVFHVNYAYYIIQLNYTGVTISLDQIYNVTLRGMEWCVSTEAKNMTVAYSIIEDKLQIGSTFIVDETLSLKEAPSSPESAFLSLKIYTEVAEQPIGAFLTIKPQNATYVYLTGPFLQLKFAMDSKYYKSSDKLEVQGEVSDISEEAVANATILCLIENPNGNLVNITRLNSDSKGRFIGGIRLLNGTEGKYSLIIQASKTGYISAGANTTFVLDITPPSVSVTASPSNPYTTQTVTFIVTANDNAGGSGIANITLYIDGNSVQTWTTVGTHTYTGGPYSEGTHIYYVEAFDNANNKGRDPSAGNREFTVLAQPAPQPVSLWQVLAIASMTATAIAILALITRRKKS